MRVSKMTVYRMVHSASCPPCRVGRSFRVPGEGGARLPSQRLHRGRLSALRSADQYSERLKERESLSAAGLARLRLHGGQRWG